MVVINEKELVSLIDNAVKNALKTAAQSTNSSKGYINARGYESASKMLGVSTKRLWEWKRESRLNGCYFQDSKTVIFFIDKIQEKMRNGQL